MNHEQIFHRSMIAAAALTIAIVSAISFNNYSRVNNPYVAIKCKSDLVWCQKRMEYIENLHNAILIVGFMAFGLIILAMFSSLVMMGVKRRK